jgi:transposase
MTMKSSRSVHSATAHAPADWIFHAKIVARSWDGLRTRQIAEELGCNPQTVRERVHAFNDRGVDGVGIKPGFGRRPRLTQLERSTILALVKLPPPGKPTYELTGELAAPDSQGEPEWPLDALTATAQLRATWTARSQVRRIFRRPHTAICVGVSSTAYEERYIIPLLSRRESVAVFSCCKPR